MVLNISGKGCVGAHSRDVAETGVGEELDLCAVGGNVVDGEEGSPMGEPTEANRDEPYLFEGNSNGHEGRNDVRVNGQECLACDG